MMLSALNTRKVIACFLVGLSAGLMSILVQELAQEFVLSSFLQGFVNFCQISEWWHLLNLSFLHIFALTMIQHSYQALRVILLHFKKKNPSSNEALDILVISCWFAGHERSVRSGRSTTRSVRSMRSARSGVGTHLEGRAATKTASNCLHQRQGESGSKLRNSSKS